MKVNKGTIRKVNLLISQAKRKLPLKISTTEVVNPQEKHSKPKIVFHKQGMR